MTQTTKKILEEKGNNDMKTISVSIEDLKLSKWDIREEKEDVKDDKFQSLKNSISMYGLFNPLTVSKSDSKYTIIAGKRRYKAIKDLGWSTVPVNVLLEDASETEIRIIKTNENMLIKSLEDVEQSLAIRAVYESAGYKGIDALYATGNIRNWFFKHPNKNWKDLIQDIKISENFNTSKRGKTPTNELYKDEAFIKICQDIAISPSWQNTLLQLVVKLPETVLEKANKIGLSTNKKLLLTQKGLEKHPRIQEDLVKDIAHMDLNDARNKVQQTARDLETGYLKPSSRGEVYLYGDPSKRDIIEKKPKEDYATEFDVIHQCNEMIKVFTGRQLEKGEFKYTKDILDKTKYERMYKIIKACNGDFRSLNSMYESISLITYLGNKMLKLLDEEIDVIEKKTNLSQK
jgi:hypothetical protein